MATVCIWGLFSPWEQQKEKETHCHILRGLCWGSKLYCERKIGRKNEYSF